LTRTASRHRVTRETDVDVGLVVDGEGRTQVATGLPFFDHMLEQLGRHAGFDLTVRAAGDLHVDGHHTVEDVGIVVGEAFGEALGDRAGVARFASGLFPLDEALIEVAVDLSGRPYVVWDVPFGEVLPLGDPPLHPDMVGHFWESFAMAARLTLHVHKRAGDNAHHVAEAVFKGVARCLRAAVRREGEAVPSTKGVL
jgi:imidazoleglycerol-phosphate dehydratase